MTKPTEGDISRAKRAIRWDSGVSDDLIDRFDGTDFTGSSEELRVIRSSMRRYEREAAGIGEDKLMYDSRFVLQFINQE